MLQCEVLFVFMCYVECHNVIFKPLCNVQCSWINTEVSWSGMSNRKPQTEVCYNILSMFCRNGDLEVPVNITVCGSNYA